MVNEKEKLKELKSWCLMLLDLWEGGNESYNSVEETIELNSLEAYKRLVEILRHDDEPKNAKYADQLEKKILKN